MNTLDAKRVLETALLCATQPLQVREMRQLFHDELEADTLKDLLSSLQQEWSQRGLELVQVASGWRMQSRPEMRDYLDRLHPEKPPKYSRAAMPAARRRAARVELDRVLAFPKAAYPDLREYREHVVATLRTVLG